DGLLLHDKRASTGRLLHGADDVSRQGLGGTDRLPGARAALHGSRLVLQHRLRRGVLPHRRAVRQHGRVDPPLDHQGHLRRRPLACGVGHPERAVAGDRLPVRSAAQEGSQSADRQRDHGGLRRVLFLRNRDALLEPLIVAHVLDGEPVPTSPGHALVQTREVHLVLDWLADHLAMIMFVSMFFVIFLGYPVAFIMGGLALIFAVLGAWLGVFKLIGLSDIVLRMWGGVANDPVLASIPMFIFMGAILERSGSAKDMPNATEVLLKWCPGALAVAVMVMGTILAAPIGVVGAAVITLSVIALPQMLAAGYDTRLAIGTIASAGTLGILIPPAIMLVVMAELLATSAGNLFLSVTMPGLLLSGLYLVYIVVVAIFKPGAAPQLPPDYGPQTRLEFWIAVWRGLFPMTLLMVVVLGSIFAGWATPTESGAVGVLGSMLIAALNNRLTLKMLNDAIYPSSPPNRLAFLLFLAPT